MDAIDIKRASRVFNSGVLQFSNIEFAPLFGHHIESRYVPIRVLYNICIDTAANFLLIVAERVMIFIVSL